VYGKHLLLRAAAQVLGILDSAAGIQLPEDIGPLVEDAYGDQPCGPGSWQLAMNEAREGDRLCREAKQRKAEGFRLSDPHVPALSLNGWLDPNAGDADETGRAQVRDSGDCLEVLLVQEAAGQWRLPDWLDGSLSRHAGRLLPMESEPPFSSVRVLAGCSVSLPLHASGDLVLDYLQRPDAMREAWQRSPRLRGQLILPLDDNRETIVPGFAIRYDPTIGLVVEECNG
jgi:hypothetical protein